MVSSAYSDPQNLDLVTGVKSDRKFEVWPGKMQQKLLRGSEIIREAMGACNAIDTMLWWSDQLFLTAENDRFEGSTPGFFKLFFRSQMRPNLGLNLRPKKAV